MLGKRKIKDMLRNMVHKSPLSSRYLGPPSDIVLSVEEYALTGKTKVQFFPASVSDDAVKSDIKHEWVEKLDRYEKVVKMEGARVLANPFCVIAPGDKILTEFSSSPDLLLNGRHPVFQYFRLPRMKFLKGETLLLASLCDNNYYHWLFQIIPKLVYLQKAGLQLDHFDHILMRHFNENYGFIRELARVFEIPLEKVRFIDTQKDLAQPSVIYSQVGCESLTFTPFFWHPQKWVCDYLGGEFLNSLPKPTVKTYDKIFLNRKNLAHRNIQNSDQYESYLLSKGFKEIEPSDYSIADQASIFSAARVIVAPHGAALSNLVFCCPATRVVEIRARQHTHLHYDAFSRIAHFRELDYHELLCEGFITNEHKNKGISLFLDLKVDMEALNNLV